jgi:hypothetical protein
MLNEGQTANKTTLPVKRRRATESRVGFSSFTLVRYRNMVKFVTYKFQIGNDCNGEENKVGRKEHRFCLVAKQELC